MWRQIGVNPLNPIKMVGLKYIEPLIQTLEIK